MNCVFCELYNRKEEVIYESKHFFARFDKFPVSPGHAEIISKRHVASLFDLVNDEWSDLQHAIIDVVKLIENTDLKKVYENSIENPLNEKSVQFCKKMLDHIGINKKPDGYNIGVNEGKAAGRTIDHLHIHIIPRYFGDIENPIGGIRNVIPKMGNYEK
ncbi:MAG: HIT family protein [Candidatus Parvarchaeota archaeon]|nr:HIT family protein [Candidatus Jingweiarchaeum tengchongense]MCW1298265.1 HIT family protein [Candidatus Jingweiarchaeum tengchongense]MCW1300356.1 HIT family protein [Candidatus Jingweiarchaeum tengchongense]MCW1304799.1 HIT family protein [Candidatus Jingweiarchaeum tengchongense]MCW1305389.1 HIT family protein [Candidatus Jingweiarchaeum tengchongense]